MTSPAEERAVPIGRAVALALSAVMDSRLHAESYDDLADRFIMLLSGEVSIVPKSDYDEMVRQNEALRIARDPDRK